LTAAATVGELWAAIPDLWLYPLSTNLPRALPAMPDLGSSMILSRTVFIEVLGPDVPVNTQLQRAEVERALYPARYPSTKGWELPQPGTAREQSGLPLLRLAWEISGNSYAERDLRVDEIAREYRCMYERWLLPSVGEAHNPLEPLMAWWAALYSLSMFARYEPVAWQQCLDVDHSEIGVSLEAGLDVALSAVPHLVLSALTGQPNLLPPR